MHNKFVDCLIGRDKSIIDCWKYSVTLLCFEWIVFGHYVIGKWGKLFSDFFFLAKNETLALPAESKTPKVEKIPAQPITGNEIPILVTYNK